MRLWIAYVMKLISSVISRPLIADSWKKYRCTRASSCKILLIQTTRESKQTFLVVHRLSRLGDARKLGEIVIMRNYSAIANWQRVCDVSSAVNNKVLNDDVFCREVYNERQNRSRSFVKYRG